MNCEKEFATTGSSFEADLAKQGPLTETTRQEVKRVLAQQLAMAMKEQKISKVEMAKRLRTSRSQLDRLLDPSNDSVTLSALSRAAQVVGRSLNVELR
jgi:hypothetical protein